MNDLNNQHEYWNRVAEVKTFTHPVDLFLVRDLVKKDAVILDYGCGYGRVSNLLYNDGFKNITGFDTAAALIRRGRDLYPHLKLISITDANSIPVEENTTDLVLLFAVLTCIPNNSGQKELMAQLYSKLKKGGHIYISDYYLQDDRLEVTAYETLDGDPANLGVFYLEEGVVFRHHTKEWIKELLKDFEVLVEKSIPVQTMNGHAADAFQLIAKKPLADKTST